MEQTLIRRDPDITSNVRVDGDLNGRSGGPQSTCGSEGLTARGGDVELGSGGAVEDGVILFVGSDDGVGGERGDGGEGTGVLRDHDALTGCGPP